MATYNDYPQSATNNAKKVLEWKKKYGKEVKVRGLDSCKPISIKKKTIV
jgi:hypothetical protein